MERWSIKQAEKAYNIDSWGDGFFSINRRGHVCVHPSPHSKYSIDLRSLVDDLIKRKIKPPILLRFMNVLKGRIDAINRAFSNAIEEYDYPAGYQTFYPIKLLRRSPSSARNTGSASRLAPSRSWSQRSLLPRVKIFRLSATATRTTTSSKRFSMPTRSVMTSRSWWRSFLNWKKSLHFQSRSVLSRS